MRLILLMVGLGLFLLLGWWIFGEGLEQAWDMRGLVGRFEEAKD